MHGLWETMEGPVFDSWKPWKDRSVEEIAVHGLWETKEGRSVTFGDRV